MLIFTVKKFTISIVFFFEHNKSNYYKNQPKEAILRLNYKQLSQDIPAGGTLKIPTWY